MRDKKKAQKAAPVKGATLCAFNLQASAPAW